MTAYLLNGTSSWDKNEKYNKIKWLCFEPFFQNHILTHCIIVLIWSYFHIFETLYKQCSENNCRYPNIIFETNNFVSDDLIVGENNFYIFLPFNWFLSCISSYLLLKFHGLHNYSVCALLEKFYLSRPKLSPILRWKLSFLNRVTKTDRRAEVVCPKLYRFKWQFYMST